LNSQAKWGWFLRSDVSPNGKIVYLLLSEYKAKYGRCYIRQQTIANQISMNRRTVVRALRELEDKRLITRKRLKSSCEYFLHISLLDNVLSPQQSDTTQESYISKVYNTNNTTYRTTKNTKKVPDLSHLGKNLKMNYKTAVHDIKNGSRLKKADQLVHNKFFTHMKSRGDMGKFWQQLIDGEIEWPEELPKLGKA